MVREGAVQQSSSSLGGHGFYLAKDDPVLFFLSGRTTHSSTHAEQAHVSVGEKASFVCFGLDALTG